MKGALMGTRCLILVGVLIMAELVGEAWAKVSGPKEVLAQVDESSGDLDEALVENRVGVLALQPKMFEDVVGLKVIARIEKGEEQFVAGGVRALCGVQPDIFGNALVLRFGLQTHATGIASARPSLLAGFAGVIGFPDLRFKRFHAVVELVDIFQEGVGRLVFADRAGGSAEHDAFRGNVLRDG